MLYLAADKHGYKAIKMVMGYLDDKKIPYKNLGVDSAEKDIPLESMIPPVVDEVLKKKENQAILSCGTGIGVEVGANKFSGIRACLAYEPKIATWARQYDNCNVLCLVGWKSNKASVNKILDAWFTTKYDGNKKRLKMFKKFNEWH